MGHVWSLSHVPCFFNIPLKIPEPFFVHWLSKSRILVRGKKQRLLEQPRWVEAGILQMEQTDGMGWVETLKECNHIDSVHDTHFDSDV